MINEIETKELLKNVTETGAFITEKLEKVAKSTKKISEVRGKGLLIGIELASDSAADIKMKLFEKGFLVSAIGANVIRIAPPLILNKTQATKFVTALKNVLTGKE